MEQENWKKIVDQYWSPEAQAEFQSKFADDGSGFDGPAYQAQWKELSKRIEAAMPLDPASDQALAFANEWFALLEPFTRVASKGMWESSARMYEGMDKWEGQADPGFSKRVWDFIREATTAARAAGRDIGPLPTWTQQN